MRLTKGGSLRNGLAMAFASAQCVPSFFTHHLMATAFSLNVRPSSAGSRDFNTYRAMSKADQTFTTWSFDEPCTTMAWTDLVGASLQVTSETSLWDLDADLIVVGVFAPQKDDSEDEADNKEKDPPTAELSGEAKVLDEKLGGAISAVMIENAKEFNHGAKAGSTTPTLRMISEGKSQRYIVVGLGKLPEGKADDLLGVGSALGKAIADKCSAEKGVASAKVLLPKGLPVDTSMLSDVSCSFYGSLYSDNRYRSGDKIKEPAKDLKTVTFVSEESTVADDAAAAVAAGKKVASGTHMAKDIVNCPHNVLNALGMADTARRIAKESGGTLKCTILGKKECEKRGMGAYLGVARASEAEPQFIHLTYTPKSGNIKKKVGIIGKGLTFDTGGYNIKTQMMELMKFDCGGAAAVLGKCSSRA
jgi:leucyl aminopeptidase